MAAVHPVDLIEPGAGRHIDLTADDGLDPRLFRCLIELYTAVHDPVVGAGNCGLAALLDPFHQLVDPAGAVQQAVLGMQMQVDELLCCAAHDCTSSALWRIDSASASSFFIR